MEKTLAPNLYGSFYNLIKSCHLDREKIALELGFKPIENDIDSFESEDEKKYRIRNQTGELYTLVDNQLLSLFGIDIEIKKRYISPLEKLAIKFELCGSQDFSYTEKKVRPIQEYSIEEIATILNNANLSINPEKFVKPNLESTNQRLIKMGFSPINEERKLETILNAGINKKGPFEYKFTELTNKNKDRIYRLDRIQNYFDND